MAMDYHSPDEQNPPKHRWIVAPTNEHYCSENVALVQGPLLRFFLRVRLYTGYEQVEVIIRSANYFVQS